MGAKHSWDAARRGFTISAAIFASVATSQGISFRQWTDVFCRAEIPLGVCDCCGAKHWNQDAEAIINEVVRREYDKFR
jgi:hypothetical protein